MFKKFSAMAFILSIALFSIFTTGCDTKSETIPNHNVTILGSAGSSRGGNYAPFAPSLRADGSFLTGLKLFVYDVFSNEIISIDDINNNNLTGDGKVIIIKSYANLAGKDLRFEIKQGGATVVKAYKTIIDTNTSVDVNCDSSALSKIYEDIKESFGSNFNYSTFEQSVINANVATNTSIIALADGIQSYILEVSNGTKVMSSLYNTAAIKSLVELTSAAQNKIKDEAKKLLPDYVNVDEVKSQFLPAYFKDTNWVKVNPQNVGNIVGTSGGGNIWLIEDYVYYNDNWYAWSDGQDLINSENSEHYIPYVFLKTNNELHSVQYSPTAMNNSNVISFSNKNALVNVDYIRENGGVTSYMTSSDKGYVLDLSASTITLNGVTKNIRITVNSSYTYVVIYDNKSAAGTSIYKALPMYN